MNKYPGRRWHIIRKYAIDTAANEFSSEDYDDDDGDDGDDNKSTHRMDRFPSQWWVMNQLRRSPGSPARRRRRGAGRERRRLTGVERSVLYAATFAGNGPAAAELIRMTVSKVPSKRTLATPLGVAVGRGAAGVALTIIAAGANPNMPADVPSQGTDMDDDDDEEEEDEEDAADDGAADADEDAAHRNSLRSGGIGNVGDSASNFERRSHLGSIFEHAAGLSNNQMSYITPSVAMGRSSGHLAVSFANGGGGGVWNSSSSTELISEIVYNDFDDCDDIAGASCTRPLCVAARSLSNPACCGVLLRAGATLRHRSFLRQPAERRATFVDHFPAEVAESVFYRLSEAAEGGGGGGGGGGSVVSPNALALASASANVFETVATMQPRGFRPSDIDWKTNNHGRYPAEFRAAAREVLMLMYHGQVNGGAGGAPLVDAPGVGGGGGDGGGGGGKGDDDEDADDEEEDGMLGMFSIFRRLPEDCLRRRVTEAVVHNLSKSTVWGMMPEEFWDWNGVGRASRRDSLSLKESVGEMYAIFDTV